MTSFHTIPSFALKDALMFMEGWPRRIIPTCKSSSNLGTHVFPSEHGNFWIPHRIIWRIIFHAVKSALQNSLKVYMGISHDIQMCLSKQRTDRPHLEMFFPLLPREASKRVPIFDRGTGSKPARLRSGFLQADLSLIV